MYLFRNKSPICLESPASLCALWRITLIPELFDLVSKEALRRQHPICKSSTKKGTVNLVNSPRGTWVLLALGKPSKHVLANCQDDFLFMDFFSTSPPKIS